MAEEYDINYCLEIVNRYEQYLLNTAAEGVDFVRELDSPKIKLLLDCFHMNIEEDSFSEAIKTAGELLGHFHIGECNRKVPGRTYGLGRFDPGVKRHRLPGENRHGTLCAPGRTGGKGYQNIP